MSLRLLRWGFAGSMLVSAAAACGVMFSPGDYRESTSPTASDGGGPAIAPDGAVIDPTAAARFLLIAGRRDLVDGDSQQYVAETIRTSVGPDGQLTPWQYDQPPSVSTAWTKAAILDGRLVAQSGTSVYHATFDGKVTSDFRGALLRGGAALESGHVAQMFDGVLLAAGSIVDGGPSTNVSIARIDLVDGGVNGFTPIQQSRLAVARASTTLGRDGKFLYAVGGREASASAAARTEVDVATLAPDLVPGPFSATTSLQNPITNTPHGVVSPSLAFGGGFIFVVGGQTTAAGVSANTDIVLASKIDTNSGGLGPWQALPRLPTPLSGGAVVFANGALYVFGGATVTVLSEAVISLAVNPDGTFGAEWKRVGTLPTGARANLAVTVY